MEKTSTVTGTAYKHRIKKAVTCDTINCINYWKCTKPNCPESPNCEYIGMTTRTFKDRLSEHRDYSKRDVITEPSVRHFTQPGNNVADMKGLVSKKSGIKTQTF